ncbi:MAG: citrate synthase [Armatimonadetes bacterium]|nr:citrate synthase [Armatimonadota bacterium]MBS1711079.1 citrate synthase [Armatimonadota bacterium]MBX3108751.1 citrate synthase [Fimbriimonadaceae bacterium]
MSEKTYPDYSPGLQGVIGGITSISKITVEKSQLEYRGYNAHDLASKGSFEETAFLLIKGHLPTQAELDEFNATLDAEREIPSQVVDALRACAPGTHQMDLLKVAYSALSGYDPDYNQEDPTDHEANVRKAIRIVAKAPTIVTAAYRVANGKEPIAPKKGLKTAANFLYMLHGEEQDDYTVLVMDASLTLYAEHTYNASTFACRVCVATLSDLYSGIVTGIGTLKGPLHGGANEEAMRMLMEIGTPENAEPWLRDALATKKKIMGFGHREYKVGDGRAIYLTEVAKEIGRRKGNTNWGDIADIMEKIMREEKGIYPNVDFPAAYAYYLLGIPIDLYTPIFVMARVSGWSAHAIEQLDDNRLIRPSCIYEGASDLEYPPIATRG